MRRIALLAAVAVLCGSAGAARADYTFTTFDVPMAAPPNGRALMGVTGLNNSGEVVGYYLDSFGVEHGYLRDAAGNFTTIDGPGSTNTDAAGINASGQIVGTFADSFGAHGFVLGGGVFTELDVPGSNETIATGISNSGLISGVYGNRAGGFLRDAAGDYTMFHVPGITNGDFFVTGVNDSGQVVGYDNGGNGGWVMNGGSFTPLDFAANGIDNYGDIVGFTSNQTGAHVVLRDASGNETTFDVPGAGSGGSIATGINDSGQIAGYYFDSSGNVHGFIATPAPEPSSLVLLGVGIAALATWRWVRS